MLETRPRLLACVGLVLGALFWSSNAILARVLAETIPPFSLTFWRWAAAALILLPLSARHLLEAGPAIRANLQRLFWLGLLGVGAYNSLLYLAAHSTTALSISLVNASIPIAIAVLAHFILHERTSPKRLAGFAAGSVGVVVIVARGDWRVLSAFDFYDGDLLMIAGVLIWALYSVLLRRWRIQLHPIGFLTITVLIGVALLLPLYAVEASTQGHFDWRLIHLPLFTYLAIFPSILSYLFWNYGIAVVGPTMTAMFIYLVPVFTAILAFVILGEALGWYHALGGLLILVGLYLATRQGSADPGAEGLLATNSAGESRS